MSFCLSNFIVNNSLCCIFIWFFSTQLQPSWHVLHLFISAEQSTQFQCYSLKKYISDSSAPFSCRCSICHWQVYVSWADQWNRCFILKCFSNWPIPVSPFNSFGRIWRSQIKRKKRKAHGLKKNRKTISFSSCMQRNWIDSVLA